MLRDILDQGVVYRNIETTQTTMNVQNNFFLSKSKSKSQH